MINTTIFKSAFILLAVVSNLVIINSHPVETEATSSSDAEASGNKDNVIIPQSSKPPGDNDKPIISGAGTGGDHYDQRQNGTKNFRLHIDGVVFVVAPAEALLLAGELDPSLLGFGGQEGFGETSAIKPGAGNPETRKPAVGIIGELENNRKPIKQKSAHSHGLRLSSLLGPILRRISP